MIESWMISVGLALVTYVGIMATQKYKTESNIEKIDENKKECTLGITNLHNILSDHNKEDDRIHGKMFDKMDAMTTELSEHKIKLANAPSMETVRAEFVSKEMFSQMSKHIDEKFDKMDRGLDKILDKLEKIEKA